MKGRKVCRIEQRKDSCSAFPAEDLTAPVGVLEVGCSLTDFSRVRFRSQVFMSLCPAIEHGLVQEGNRRLEKVSLQMRQLLKGTNQ